MDVPLRHRIKYGCCFYAITFPALIIVVPLLILAICNPFWFRESALINLQRLVEKFSNWRYNLLTPIRTKYELFDVIRKTTMSSGPEGSP